MIGPPPEYFGSSPYSKNAWVGSPLGVTEPENPAPVTLTVGAVVVTVGGNGFDELGGPELAGAITAVRFEVACADPVTLVAVTITWTVCPTSFPVSEYVFAFVPVFAQFWPLESQSCHW